MATGKNQKREVSFFHDVYEVVKLIPKGRVTSYGAIAHYLGLRSGARMVGWAMHGCPKGVPAHRVVNSQGLLTGKHQFKTPTTMQRLLAKEGVRVSNDKIVDFNARFWDPSTELL
ncbi:MAG TPA: MGMT family protein [Chryseosolibacter sp.]|nr:MGMT family protein [Chryseosolibacter sp.]